MRQGNPDSTMSQQANFSGRLHALDNLRAVMMWLGIVLHVAAIHTVMKSPLPWHDPQTSEWADLLAAVIHSFRMPVFFIVAGFFVLLLLRQRGALGMLKNRLARLGLPFALLWPPLFLVSGALALLYLHRMARGSWGLDEALVPPRAEGPIVNTMHLWFIWMLLWFSALTALGAPQLAKLPARWHRWLSVAFVRGAASPLAGVWLAVPLGLIGTAYKGGMVLASGAFFPPLTEWLHNGLFFAFGLALFAHREQLLAHYRRHWRGHAIAGALLFVAVLALASAQQKLPAPIPQYRFWFALSYGMCGWLWSFALIGWFVGKLDRPHAVLDYLAQSAYWVYLIHLPLTIGFGALLYELPLGALSKMALNIAATTLTSLLSYHLFVRCTALGQMLNGRRHAWRGFWPQRRDAD